MYDLLLLCVILAHWCVRVPIWYHKLSTLLDLLTEERT